MLIVFKNSILTGSYLSPSINDAKTITGADFSDAQMSDFARKKLCQREDAVGTNPVTGVDTRDSLFCE